MDLQRIKSGAFQHGEKVIVIAVILYVAYSLLTHFSSEAVRTTGGPTERGRGQKREIPQHIEPYYLRVTVPYVADEAIADLRRDPYWPPVTVELPVVHDLQMETPGKAEVRLTAESDIVGEPRLSKPTDAELARLERLYPSGDFSEEWKAKICKVQVRVDPTARNALIVKALDKGSWTAYEATLANDDKCRVFIRVKEEGVVEVWIVLKPEITSAKEEEIGKVVVRFKDSPPPVQEPGSKTFIHVMPTAIYRIYRQADHENQKRFIHEIPVGAAGTRRPGAEPTAPIRPYRIPPPRGVPRPGLTPEEAMEGTRPTPRRPVYRPRRPGGLSPEERMEGGGPAAPARPARPGEGIKAADLGTHVFVDRSVESETTYKYWVEAYAPPDPARPTIVLKPKMSEPRVVKTRQKFAVLYVGNSPTTAKIMVFIGSVDQYIAYRTYSVPIGGWIGEPPGKAVPAPAPDPAAPKPPTARRPGGAAAEEVGDVQFVTRFILVDIIPQAYRAIEQIKTRAERDPATGKIIMVKRTTLRGELARQILVRNRKNELVRLWQQPAPKLGATTRTAGRTVGRTTAPYAYEREYAKPGERRRRP